MNREARFWDRTAARYAKRPVGDEAAYNKKLAKTREYLGPDIKVLEFGCGTGSTALAHAPYVAHIRATDISAKMIEIARAKAEAKHAQNVTFERTSIEELDVPKDSIDVVLGLSILHLVADREGAIVKVYRMLKPGGVFISNTACLGDKLKVFKLIGPIGRLLGLIPRVEVFTRRQLMDSLCVAGFQIDYQWQPGSGVALFVVARKPA